MKLQYGGEIERHLPEPVTSGDHPFARYIDEIETQFRQSSVNSKGIAPVEVSYDSSRDFDANRVRVVRIVTF